MLFKIEKEGKIFTYIKEQFEKTVEVEYLPSLEFEKNSYLKKIKKYCKKAELMNFFSKEQLWLGSYYHKELKSGFIPNVIVKWIDPIMEYGLFANQDFEKGAFLGEYTGIIKKYRPIIDDKNAYCFEYTIGYKKTKYTIDAREKGSLIRFVNHSSSPNLSPIAIVSDNVMHIIFRTNRHVAKDEELTYDYGPNYWAKREKPL